MFTDLNTGNIPGFPAKPFEGVQKIGNQTIRTLRDDISRHSKEVHDMQDLN